MNRFDGIVEFNALSKENLLKIVDLMITDMNAAIAEKGLHIDVTSDVKQKIVDLGYNPEMGARPLRRVIQEQLEDQIADFYLDNPDIKQLTTKLVDDNIQIEDGTKSTL